MICDTVIEYGGKKYSVEYELTGGDIFIIKTSPAASKKIMEEIEILLYEKIEQDGKDSEAEYKWENREENR